MWPTPLSDDVELLIPCRTTRGPNGEPITRLFFSSTLVEQERAKALCEECGMRALCLQRAIDLHAEGIWGGFDDIERGFWTKLFGRVVGPIVQPLPKSLVQRLRANRVMRTGPDVVLDEALEG